MVILWVFFDPRLYWSLLFIRKFHWRRLALWETEWVTVSRNVVSYNTSLSLPQSYQSFVLPPPPAPPPSGQALRPAEAGWLLTGSGKCVYRAGIRQQLLNWNIFQVDRRHYGDRGGADPGGMRLQVSSSPHLVSHHWLYIIVGAARRSAPWPFAGTGSWRGN